MAVCEWIPGVLEVGFQLSLQHPLSLARNHAHLGGIDLLEILSQRERRIAGQQVGQCLGNVAQAGEVYTVRRHVAICCIVFGRNQKLSDVRHVHHLLLLYLHVAFLQLVKQVHAVHREHQERVVVYLAAHHVDDGGQMLARHRPVGARALHVEVVPSLRKQVQPYALGHLEHLRVELAVQQLRDERRLFQQRLHQLFCLLLLEQRHTDGHLVGRRPTAAHLCRDDIPLHVNTFHSTFPGIRRASRYAVRIVDVRQRLQPLAAPPCLSKRLSCHFESELISCADGQHTTLTKPNLCKSTQLLSAKLTADTCNLTHEVNLRIAVTITA